MKGFNPNWPMWVNDSTFGRRHPPASSSATASAGTWIGSRNPTSSWENSQSSEIGSNQNLDYNRLGSPSHSLSSPLGPNSRHVRVASRIVGEDGNLNATISTDTDDRSVITVKPLHPTQRYEAQTMTHPSLNTITAYGNGPTPAGIDDLTMGLRGMVVDEDQGVSAIPQGALFRQHGPPSMAMHPGIHIRQPISQPQQRPYSLYPSQGDYTTYYTGPALPDYPFNYDYRANADPAVYASPIMANNIASGHLYPITQAVQASSQTSAEIHRQAHGMIYDYSGAAPAHPSGSYYYTTHPPVLFHPQEVSHSPTLQVLGGIPATMGVKKQRYDHFHLNTQQNLLMQSVRHPTPPSHSYNAPLQYMSSPPVMMPGNPVFGQPQINSSSMTLYSQHTRPSRRGHHLETGVVLRSPVLEEFRTNKARKWEIQEILGHVTEFSGDQHGSRFLQQKLETASMDERQSVFDEIVPVNALRLIMDVFGNYVIQKLFEYGTQLQRSALIDSMEGHILPLSLQMYGCRVVQKAIECALPEQQTIFVKELDPHVHRCVRDANGNHVIQKLIERVPAERLPFIHMFKSCIYELSTHPYGCRVLQRCFEHLDEDRARPLLDEVHKYAINLMQDQFGNYVMQFILENGKPLDKALVISKLRGQLLNMARHKFASNVCEKALTTADDKSRRILIDEILTPRQDGVSPIVTMMKDQFANYVLQRALAVAEGEQKELLTSKIKQQLQTMRRYSSVYSKHLASIERTLEKSSNQKESDSQTIILENISKISASTD